MNKLRPTIPIANWKVALNIEESQKVQNQESVPAFNCDCESCEHWRKMYEKVLPEGILLELKRLGINLDTPSDAYEHGSGEDGRHFRIIFHIVGRILSGPEAYRCEQQIDSSVLNYQVTRETPYFSIVVLPYAESYDKGPIYEKSKKGELITIDMRLSIP
ncbi:hypothetical protein FLL45_02565 [Aliikangiella marina]|uniref:Uncharacterized protein n=1 Tax=Aliikangiella marina TaxID=1712262 RepID=A0A545TI31_9GAMM|nr:hypothetical protein [Aliikangiella marina]TQV76858.1 hypothetical protein FLL45_02565 [Aliikangiella marina]